MEKAPIDTSNIEEKAEEIIAEAEPPPEVYLYWVVFYSNMMRSFFVLFFKVIVCMLNFVLRELVL